MAGAGLQVQSLGCCVRFPADVRRPHSTNRGVALYDDLVYVGTLDARVVALEATTGEMVWERAVAYYRHGYYITLAPLVVDGKVMVGTSGGESSVAVSYAVRGVQYVALQIEPRPEFPDAGNRVLAFALDCQC